MGRSWCKRAKWLQEIFHREDPTRPVTVGMDQVKATMESGFGAAGCSRIELSGAFI
jgi:beta-galactosidase